MWPLLSKYRPYLLPAPISSGSCLSFINFTRHQCIVVENWLWAWQFQFMWFIDFRTQTAWLITTSYLALFWICNWRREAAERNRMCDFHFVSVVRRISGFKVYFLSPDHQLIEYLIPTDFYFNPWNVFKLNHFGCQIAVEFDSLCSNNLYCFADLKNFSLESGRKIYKMSLNSSLHYDHGAVFDYHQNQFLSPERFGRQYHENFMVSYLFSRYFQSKII